MSIPGPSRRRGRPRVTLQRPERIAVRDRIVRCYYRGCTHSSGPYISRDDAVAAAIVHYERHHKRAASDAG